jgi:hypothetical protein
MAFSREIIKKVLQYVRFRVPQTEEKNSYYTEIGNTLVRVSNHCTWLYRWDEILEKNPKWKGKPIVSIVFEDSGNTFSNKCLVLRRFRMKPIKVMEYVYPLQGNPQFITPQDERLIINGIKQIQGGKYTDLTNKCSEPILRISQNPPDVPPTKTMNNNENKQYKSNTNMNKKLIRLTESDLHKIVKESVNRILRENSRRKSRMIKEGGHLFHQDDDGTVHTNSTQTWRGVPGTKFIYHGEWSDSEILYKGKLINANDAEEGLEYAYQSDVEDRGYRGSFDDWVNEQDPRYLSSFLDEYIMN